MHVYKLYGQQYLCKILHSCRRLGTYGIILFIWIYEHIYNNLGRYLKCRCFKPNIFYEYISYITFRLLENNLFQSVYCAKYFI